MTEIAPLLGVLAGAIRGTTRPHRGTWLIWGAGDQEIIPRLARNM
jgi:hypothetical protein